MVSNTIEKCLQPLAALIAMISEIFQVKLIEQLYVLREIFGPSFNDKII